MKKTYSKPELKVNIKNAYFNLMADSQTPFPDKKGETPEDEFEQEQNKRWRRIWGDYQ